jgi:NADH-quinone oxidoreductase subunit E
MMETVSRTALADIFSRHKNDSGELIAILQDVQKEFGYLPKESMREIARHLKLPESNVFGVATFYAQFKLSPAARRVVKVCSGTACHVKGNGDILAAIQHELGIKPGETTKDFKYSLQLIACFGACALAPVMVVDKTVYGRVTPEKISQILKQD